MLYMISFIRNTCGGMNRKNQLLFLLDGVLINGAYIITTGTLLSGYAIYLGASDFLTSLLNNSANYTTTLSILSFIIFERMSKRKNTLLTLNILSRLLICLIALLPPIFHTKPATFALLAFMVIASDVIWGIYRVGWLVWMMDAVPRENRTQYVYLRTFLVRVFCSVVSMATGFILDMYNKEYTGFLIVFLISFILSALDVAVLWKVDDSVYRAPDSKKFDYRMFLQPVRHGEYRNYLLFIFAFYLFLTMASSFTPVYQIRYLKLDYKFISAISVISQIVMVVSGLFWSRVESKRGFKFAMTITAFFVAGELLILTFLRSDTFFLLYLSTFLAGIGMGGFGTSIFTYRYAIMPEDGKTVYEGWFYFASGLGMLIAPFAGELLRNNLPGFTNAVFQYSKIQLLYLISFSLICLLLMVITARNSGLWSRLFPRGSKAEIKS